MVLFGSQARGEALTWGRYRCVSRPAGASRPGEEIVHTGELTAAFSSEDDAADSCVFISAEQFSMHRARYC
jgi:hypothetical protein